VQIYLFSSKVPTDVPFSLRNFSCNHLPHGDAVRHMPPRRPPYVAPPGPNCRPAVSQLADDISYRNTPGRPPQKGFFAASNRFFDNLSLYFQIKHYLCKIIDITEKIIRITYRYL